jgi:hypothetical protein
VLVLVLDLALGVIFIVILAVELLVIKFAELLTVILGALGGGNTELYTSIRPTNSVAVVYKALYRRGYNNSIVTL